MRVLLDVNLSPECMYYLAEAHIHAVHWTAVGSPSATDLEILLYASSHGDLIFTQDADFGRLLAISAKEVPSVCYLRAGRVKPILLSDAVPAALRPMLEAGAGGLFSVVDARRIRVVSLPLRRKDSALR